MGSLRTFPALIAALFLPLPGCLLQAEETVPATTRHLEITGSKQLRLTYDFTCTWPRGGGYSAKMYLPWPPETGSQHIEHFSSTLKGETITDEANPPRKLLTSTLRHGSGDERKLHWHVEIVGRFQTRQLVDGPAPAAQAPIVPPAPGAFLASTESINWDTDAFRSWLDATGLHRKEGEAAGAYGQRLYAYMRSHGAYTYPPSSPWNAAAACRRLRSDCGGFSLVFTAACRANKIPARLLVGQWFKSRRLPDGTVTLTDGRQSHVIAEFFDPQIGWIPEDISSTFLKTPGYPDLNFFGRDPGFFFCWYFDTDFHLDTPQKPNAHVQWIQNPSLWFSENASDVYDSMSHHWNIEPVN